MSCKKVLRLYKAMTCSGKLMTHLLAMPALTFLALRNDTEAKICVFTFYKYVQNGLKS